MKPNLEPPVDQYYQAPLRSRTRKHERIKVSIFDVNYPTPEQCWRILGANVSVEKEKAKKPTIQKVEAVEGTLPQKQAVTDSTMLDLPENMSHTSLNSHVLVNRLIEQVSNCTGVDHEVISKISEVAEGHLHELLLQLSEIAGHRSEPLRMNQMYQQISDPRKQLKFFEEYEKKASTRQETVEKEAILKASKTKDSAQKSNEIKNVKQEEKLNREANEAAFAALSGHCTTKNWDTFDPMKASIGQGMSTQPLRTRTRRIAIRDLQCAIDCRNIPGNALIKLQLAYGI